jgi:hypothetical protein
MLRSGLPLIAGASEFLLLFYVIQRWAMWASGGQLGRVWFGYPASGG